MTLSQNVLSAIESASFSTRGSVDSQPCALEPFGCSGVVALDRIQVQLADGTLLGLCPNFVKHGQIAKAAGPGSEAQRLFSFLISAFQTANPGRERGSQDPIQRWVQPSPEAVATSA